MHTDTELLPNALEPVGFITAHKRVKHPNVRLLSELAVRARAALEVIGASKGKIVWVNSDDGGKDGAEYDALAEEFEADMQARNMAYLSGLRYAQSVLEGRVADIFLTDVSKYLPQMAPDLTRALAEATFVVRELRVVFAELTGEDDALELDVVAIPPSRACAPGDSVSADSCTGHGDHRRASPIHNKCFEHGQNNRYENPLTVFISVDMTEA